MLSIKPEGIPSQDSWPINYEISKGQVQVQVESKTSKFRLYGWLIGKILMAAALMLTPIIIKYPYLPKILVYEGFREIGRFRAELSTSHMLIKEGKNFKVKYDRSDRDIAAMVLETADKYYAPIAFKYNYQRDEKITIILHSSREELRKAFGWDEDVSAMGVYYTGVIRVLSPLEWVGESSQDKIKKVFEKAGPMPHEFAHLVIDYKSKGNYPRWFTEGLAQREEAILTGFKFNSKEGRLNQTLYTFAQLDREFDALPNQALAYSQSLAAIDYMVSIGGKDAPTKMLEELAKGQSVSVSLKQVLGLDIKGFEQGFNLWVKTTVG